MDRRQFFTLAAVGGAATATGYGLGRSGVDEAVATARYHADSLLGGDEAAKLWYRFKFIDQPVMDTQLLFFLGLAPSGLTDVGEVLDVATRVVAGDEVSWFEAWLETAQRVHRWADEALADGRERTAGAHYLRAGCYYRGGLIRYARHDDPRLFQAAEASMACHDRALRLRGYHSEEVQIPYEGSVLFGRHHFAPGVDVAPVLVLHQGLHAWPEDTMWVIDEALARGYHVLSVHGPGQGMSLRRHGHPFRYDWEAAVGAVLDHAEHERRFDMGRVILMGLSFGGYLAPRAAAYDHRIHTLVANPGVLSWADAMLRHFHDMPGLMPLHERGPDAFDKAIAAVSLGMPDADWYFRDVTWKHGVSTPHEVVDELQKYDNRDGVGKIRAKTLIMEGVAEDATPGQSQKLYDALSCPKHLMVFDERSGSQTHCQGGGTTLAAVRLFDWLDSEVRS